jgi:hypothetical protein
MTYIHCAFAVGSPVRTLIENALQGRPRQMFISIADALIAKGRKQGRRAGLSEGLARAVLGVLEHRFSSVPAEVRRRVVSSQDERQLARWLERALTVGSAAELLEDDG